MSDQAAPNWSFIEWGISLAGAAYAAALGHLHVRINRAEDQQRADSKDSREDRHDLRNQVQNAMADQARIVDGRLARIEDRVNFIADNLGIRHKA